MNIRIVAVDKMRERYLADGCAHYVQRLAPYASVAVEEIRAGLAPGEEAAALLKRAGGGVVWALDREGAQPSSLDLARAVADVERSGARELALVIGGPDGLSRGVIERAAFVWSLSRLTFLHEMARLIALEQLYRAMKINRAEPYHR